MTELAPGVDAYFEVVDGAIRIWSRFEHADRCRAIPNRRWTKHRLTPHWQTPATPSSVAAIAKLFGDLTVECDEAFMVLVEMSEQAEEGRQLRDRDDLEDHPSKFSSWLHQRKAYQMGMRLQGFGLWADMGTGKSKVVVDLIANRGHRLVLIVAPKKAAKIWPRQFREFYSGPENAEVITLDERLTIDQRAQSIRNMAPWSSDRPVIFVTNYQAFNSVKKNPEWVSEDVTPGVDKYLPNPMAEVVLNTPWDLVVADEAHNLKGPNTTLCNLFAKFASFVPHRIGLSGTPQANGPLDVWGIYRFLDPGIFPQHFGSFRRQHAICDPMFPSKVTEYYDLDKLAEKMYSIAYRVTSDVLDLPEFHHIYRHVTLSPRAMKAHNEMRKQLATRLSEIESAVVGNTLTRDIRLAQITSGFLPVERPATEATEDDPEGDGPATVEIVRIDRSKQEELEAILEEVPNLPLEPGQLTPSPEPVVVFCRFRHDLDVIKASAEAMGRRYGELSGRRDTLLDADGRMKPGIDVAAVQIAAGGVGVDLTRSRYAIFYSKDYNGVNYEQALKRQHRPGQNRPDPANPGKALPVVYYHLVARGTIDVLVERALRDKANVAELVWRFCTEGIEIDEEV